MSQTKGRGQLSLTRAIIINVNVAEKTMFGINVRGIKNHIKTECDAKLHVMMCQTDNKTWSCSKCGKEMKNRIDIWRPNM